MVSNRFILTTRRTHIIQKVKIAGERTLCLSVQDDEYPLKSLFDKMGIPFIQVKTQRRR